MRSIILLAALASVLLSPLVVRADDGAAQSDRTLRLLRVYTPRTADVYQLHRLGLDLIHRESARQTQVAATDQDIAALEAHGYRFEILELDLEAYYRRRLGPDVRRYHTLEEVVQELDRLHAARPDLVGQKVSIGKSCEGRDLWAVKISDHPEEDEDEPEVIFDALHHAREPVGMETLLAAMWRLVEDYDHDAEIRYLVDERELWFVPVVNPDGYAFNGIGGLWRKNRRVNEDGTIGVDLNRNYGFRWGYDNLGSSPVAASQTYRGPHPFSEPETRAMRDFMIERRFATGMTIHTFSDVHLLPYGWADVRPRHWSDFQEIGYDLQRWTNYPFGQPGELLYFSNGRTQDWAYHDAGIIMIEPEIGRAEDGFWPSAERVDELVAINLPSLFHVARIAGAHVEPVEWSVIDDQAGDGHADPGERIRIEVQLRNKGYQSIEDLVATLTSPTPSVIVHSPPQRIGRIAARTTQDAGALIFELTLTADTSIGDALQLDLDLVGERQYSAQHRVELVVGRPRLIFADDAEGGLDRWLADGEWGIVEAPDVQGRSFTDSPYRPYRPNTDSALVLKEPLDLTAYSSAVLTFRERYYTEPWVDHGIVEVSVNDHDWIPVGGNSGGAQGEFRTQTIRLDPYAGEPRVRLRFRLVSNNLNEKDGWMIDDIEVRGYRSDARMARTRRAPITAWVAERTERASGALAELRLALSHEQPIALGLLDATGELVTTLVNEALAPGEHVVAWDGRDGSGRLVASGVYFYELVTPEYRETLKVVVDIE